MFCLEVEYLLGRSFAGDFQDRASSEWPPHPGRLYSALVAAYFENGEDAREKAALEWLEGQAPPSLRAGSAGEGATAQGYVPTNYPGDGVPVLRLKQPRAFPAQGPSDAVVHFIWPAGVPPEVADALDRLASRTAYLGKACSLVRVRAVPEAPEPNYIPDVRGRSILRVPNRGRLEELSWLFEADRRPSPGVQQAYRRLEEAEAEAEPVSSEFGQVLTFRKTSGPGLPIDATLTLTNAVRSALMSNAGKSGVLPEVIHGHSGEKHCAVAALPFAGWEHADGDVKGFAIILPRDVQIRDRRAVLAASEDLVQHGVAIKDVGHWTVEAVEGIPPNRTLRAATWTRKARVWETITPILLDRFPKKKGPTVEEIIAASCRRIGLPEARVLEHGPYSKLRGVPPVPSFRLSRPGDERPRWGVHATLEFPVVVRGPMLLGAGRYFGLGLLRPKEGEQDERS